MTGGFVGTHVLYSKYVETSRLPSEEPRVSGDVLPSSPCRSLFTRALQMRLSLLIYFQQQKKKEARFFFDILLYLKYLWPGSHRKKKQGQWHAGKASKADGAYRLFVKY